jgi:FixJ family two-component response regulator
MRKGDIAHAPNPIEIAVVSDDPTLRDTLAALLRHNGFRVQTFSRAEFPADSPHTAVVLGSGESREPRRDRRRVWFHGAELLTAREIDVLEQIADGASNEEAAQALGISRRTVESHRASLLEKLGARNTAALIRIVLDGGR